MLQFLNLKPDLFGMDINDLSVRIAKLKRVGRGFKLVAFNEVVMEPGVISEGVIQDQTKLVQALALAHDSCRGRGLATSGVIVSLPEEKSFSQVIQLPRMDRQELEKAISFEAENYIPLTIDKVYLDFKEVDAHHGATRHLDLLINVMPRSIVDSYIACLKRAKLVPYVLEIESQAIARALFKKGQPVLPSIIIDFGQTRTSFIIFSRDSVRFTSSITFSSNQLTQALAEKLNLTASKAEALKIKYGLAGGSEKARRTKELLNPLIANLAAQIRKLIQFYHDHVASEYLPADGTIERIVLCGGGANLKQLPETLSQAVGMSVELGNPFANLRTPTKDTAGSMSFQQSLAYVTAIGSALRAARVTETEW